ncbi:FAD dependent oxidoreductase [Rhizorhabdus wittichii RW1]|uniref:FAD dependent oxidoreductase n=1 Tax=Rhizorhabdus wittichii (strain DSM 6014 / CCUG 31198 / JCM 15750 / NBRC 105917 / EY 4224 / RW1) TaxID=392499 RepID=A0A9J9H9H5_RHIWR|nr:FAD dependent oxidoreductase [Rhizorhabdus wittichii RW1]
MGKDGNAPRFGGGADISLGMGCPITRRDFVNGSLAASGVLALGGPASARGTAGSVNRPSGSAWTGYGGVGDYQWANGNTEAVVNAAHELRDGLHDMSLSGAVEEDYDLVVVGGGFTGLTAAYEFSRRAKAGQKVLLLENHPFPGGEAKQNEIDVDGIRVVGPQGSNGAAQVTPALDGTPYETYANYVRELGIPLSFELQPLGGGAEKLELPNEHFDSMFPTSLAPLNYYFGPGQWAANPARQGFTNTPWPANEQRDLDDFVHNRRDLISREADPDRWLDSMTYAELLRKLGYGDRVIDFADPYLAVGLFGVSSEAVSAKAVSIVGLSGTKPTEASSKRLGAHAMSFPGGNAGIYRAMLRKLVPESFAPQATLDQVMVTGSANLAALDRPGQRVRIRCGSMAVRVEHVGAPRAAEQVMVTYLRDGKLHRVRGRSVVIAAGGWVTRRLVRDLTPELAQAFSGLRYGPVLVVNVAVRNWRWLAKLGLPGVRSFAGGLFWHVTARQNFALGSDRRTLTPDTPLMLTFYIPVLKRGEDPDLQGALARMDIMQWSYADIERRLRTQMNDIFGPSGFEARRDIAGIVVNRWGHAYSAPRPGFFFAADGSASPQQLLQTPHGRVVFCHSELEGRQSMANAMLQGRRGALDALNILDG